MQQQSNNKKMKAEGRSGVCEQQRVHMVTMRYTEIELFKRYSIESFVQLNAAYSLCVYLHFKHHFIFCGKRRKNVLCTLIQLRCFVVKLE